MTPTNSRHVNQARMPKQNTNFTIGIFLGFALGFSSALFLSWSNDLRKVENAAGMNGHPLNRQLAHRHYSHSNIRASSKMIDAEGNGWKNIHVFYGNNSHLFDASDIPNPYFRANKWFSQYRQDEIVSKLLHGKRGGYFIDLAANDAVRISNTYALETHFDWNGLCLEPNPIYWTGLSYRKCHVVAAIAGSKTMEEVLFRFPKEKAPKGGIVGNTFDNKDDPGNEAHPRFTISLLEVFKKFKVPRVIDYISLDVEGAEDLVMSSFPFSQYRFDIMTVERPSDVLSMILNKNGYVLMKTIKKNIETLWVHHSILSTLDKTALEIDSQNYKHRERGQLRVVPEDHVSTTK